MSDEPAHRLNELVERYGLPHGAKARLDAVLELLAGDVQAPTAVRERRQAVDVHIADSLAGLEIDAVRGAERIADLGSGAGFPGVPLAIALPDSEIRLVESQARKCAFLQRLAAAASLTNVEIANVRAEAWDAGIGVHDLVLARAIAPATVVQEYAAPLLKVGGALVDWRGRRDPDQERHALAAAAQLGFERAEIRRVQPFHGAQEHHLHIYLKVRPTPERFPRRPGIARKRPLGPAGAPVAATSDRDRR